MLTYSTKKKIKLNTHEAVRENISLNKNSKLQILNDFPTNIVCENSWICQLAEINLINNLSTKNLSKKSKLIVKWWEN